MKTISVMLKKKVPGFGIRVQILSESDIEKERHTDIEKSNIRLEASGTEDVAPGFFISRTSYWK